MASYGGPDIVNEGLIFGYDTGNPVFTNNINTRLYLGRPTTNISSGIGMITYNNVPGSVSSVLEATSETFQGAQVIKQTLTPLDANGVSWLSNGNNPGIGVYTSGGGGLANRYTGHSIFFKPTVPMNSAPIYTNYSNIGGWQSSTLNQSVGNGWFRAYVTWYDTVTRSDGKFWAINPLQAVLNQPIVIYWAGPFKEDLNSQEVSPYVFSSRSSTGALIDQRRSSAIDVSTVSFSSTTNTMFFDGSDDYTALPNTPQWYTNDWTWETVIKFGSNSGTYQGIVWAEGAEGGGSGYSYLLSMYNQSYFHYRINNVATGWTNTDFTPSGFTPTNYNHLIWQFNNGTTRIYINGALVHTNTSRGAYNGSTNSPLYVGARNDLAYDFAGEIPVLRFYNRTLTASEVSQNFQIYRRRFGI